jgi:hypothetical protein
VSSPDYNFAITAADATETYPAQASALRKTRTHFSISTPAAWYPSPPLRPGNTATQTSIFGVCVCLGQRQEHRRSRELDGQYRCSCRREEGAWLAHDRSVWLSERLRQRGLEVRRIIYSVLEQSSGRESGDCGKIGRRSMLLS